MQTRSLMNRLWTLLFALAASGGTMQLQADELGGNLGAGDAPGLEDQDLGSLDDLVLPEEPGEAVPMEDTIELEGDAEDLIFYTTMDGGDDSAADESGELPIDGELVEFLPVDSESEMSATGVLMNSAAASGGALSDTVVEQIGATGALDAELSVAPVTPAAVLSATPAIEAVPAAAAEAPAAAASVRISGGHLVGADPDQPSIQ